MSPLVKKATFQIAIFFFLLCAGATSIRAAESIGTIHGFEVFVPPGLSHPWGVISGPSDIIELQGTLDANDALYPDDTYFEMYQITFLYDSHVEIRLDSSEIDPFLGLIRVDSTQQLIEILEDDDSGPGVNARITADVQAGTYWIFVNAWDEFDTGAWSLVMNSSTSSRDSSLPIVPTRYGVSVQENPNPYILGELRSGDFVYDGRFVDIYQFDVEVSENISLQIDLTSEQFDTRLMLANVLPDGSLGSLFVFDEDGGESTNSRIIRSFDSGRYFLVASSDTAHGSGQYEISVSVKISSVVAPAPDLIVSSVSLSNDTLETGQSFTLGAEVHNYGDDRAESTTLRYYRSANATVSPSDLQVGVDSVGALEPRTTSSEESIFLTAPSSPGTYYFGACVDSVAGEVNTANNCSPGWSVTVTSAGSGDHGNDRAALMALYNATDGSNWAANANWGSSVPLSQWHGVTTDISGRVTIINLRDNQLSGPIPTESGSLSNLEHLNLSNNQLSGPIPAELGNLSNLQYLSLYNNQLSDSIPAELGNLSNLRELDLGENELSGPIPVELSSLSNLRSLGLWGNELSGPIPAELGNLSNLSELWLLSNQLSGPIPAELGNLFNLHTLLLYGNQLSGPIPAELGNLSNLVNLNLGGNQLSGCIPDGLQDVTHNDFFRLGLAYCEDSRTPGGGQETTHGVGDTLSDLPSGSWTPDVTSNGSFSSSGGNVTIRLNEDGYIEEGSHRYTCQSSGGCVIENRSVTSGTVVQTASGTAPSGTVTGTDDRAALMALYNATDGPNWANNANWGSDAPLNQWHGVITDDNGRVTDIDLRNNQLSGPVPSDFGNLASLEILDLESNQLSGPIPVELGSLSNLEVLVLWGNELSGPIPVELGSLSNLGELSLGSNELSGLIPVELASLSNLEHLSLSHNDLSGPIPAELGGLSNLRVLFLGGNQLSGPIPTELGSLSNLRRLSLYENQLSGPIPAELGNLSNLQDLILYSNQLSGPIPTELGRLSNLEGLWVYNNQLSGPIPAELGDLAKLQWLRLSGNQLSGCIPDGLGNVADNDLSTLGLTYCGDSGTSPTFAGVSGPGNQSYTAGTAIAALTLPAAGGGDGSLTYSLSPEVPGLIFNATASLRELTGTPSKAGTYDMTYRVRDTDGDTDSLTFTITVTEPASEPDLVVESASVSDSSPEAGASFTLSATVRNRGDGESGSTTLRYYRSSNSTIFRSDTQVGTDSVSGLSASGTSAESISLTAPLIAGAYYYGACVDSVSGESDTGNNCSSGVRVTVSSTTNQPPDDGGCVEVNDVVELGEGESCTITQALVDKYSLDRVSIRVGDTATCSGGRVSLSFISALTIQLNGLTIRCR